MKKIFPVLCAIFVFVLLGGCEDDVVNNTAIDSAEVTQEKMINATEKISKENIVPQENKKIDENFTGNLKDITASGKSAKCMYEVTAPGAEHFSYTVFIGSKGDARIESTINDPSFLGQINSVGLMLGSQDLMYSWTDQSNQGVKMKFSDMEKMTEKFQDENPQSTPDPNMEIYNDETIEFKCVEWDVDVSKLTVPSDIQFQDMGAMMNSFM